MLRCCCLQVYAEHAHGASECLEKVYTRGAIYRLWVVFCPQSENDLHVDQSTMLPQARTSIAQAIASLRICENVS